MPLPTITINVTTPTAAAAAAPSPTIDDVVGVVGVLGTSATATAGTLLVGDSIGDFSTLGAGDTLDAITQMLNQVEVDVVCSPVATTATNTQVEAAIDLLATHGRPITMVLLTGVLGGTGATQSPNIEHLKEFVGAPGRLARAVVNADNTGTTQMARETAAKAWAPANLGERVWGVFNGPDGGYSSGAMLGAALRVAAQRGRGWGIQMGRVTGAGVLENNLALGSDALTQLDATGLCSLITFNGETRIAGGSFNYTDTTDPRRDWSVARVVDHAEHVLRNVWLNNLVGSTASLSVMANTLESGLRLLIGRELSTASVSPVSAEGGSRTFAINMGVRTPAGDITVNITLVLA